MGERKRIGLRDVRAIAPGETVWDTTVPGFGARRQKGPAVPRRPPNETRRHGMPLLRLLRLDAGLDRSGRSVGKRALQTREITRDAKRPAWTAPKFASPCQSGEGGNKRSADVARAIGMARKYSPGSDGVLRQSYAR
jgi:hypothetical protein